MPQATDMKFNIPEMHCQSCIRSITAAVRQVDNAAEVQADLQTRQVTVRSGGSAAAIAAAIEDAGFSAQSAG
ncbi:heavy-metal-associated domain-containing protein [Acidocella sp. KAb 2-4]|uniref:heavy-metal-associated domain-containing protein n=1 Tax=Acidocella sp. KAb 2-4 TaxID=2885158 RepID=UPI001D067569|nr:heavy-metal-associated domain-containing protein [Acidocella sp. KAb 2-4]MCB5943699.1 heavy-metal-associated domain-containing protein [Acidocella sp. KAb 2-4]